MDALPKLETMRVEQAYTAGLMNTTTPRHTGERDSTIVNANVWLAGLGVLLVPHLLFLFQPFFMDEQPIASNVIVFFSRHTVVPTHTLYPTFYSYLAAPFIAIGSLLYFASGRYSTLGEAVWSLSSLDPLTFVFPARILSLGCLILTAVLLWRFSRHRFGVVASFSTAAALLASPALMEYGSYALPDAAVLLFATLSLIFAAKFTEMRGGDLSIKNLMLAAAFSGLAISTKYNAASSVIPVGLSLLYLGTVGSIAIRRCIFLVLLSGAVCLSCFVLGSPGWLLAPRLFISGLMYEVGHAQRGHLGASGVPLVGQLELLLTGAPMILIGGALGIVSWLRARDSLGWLALAAVSASIGLAASSMTQSVHYMYPAIPGLLILGAAFWDRFKTRNRMVLVVLAMILIPQVIEAYSQGWPFVSAPNTTAMATDWMYRNVPEGTRVSVDWAYVPMAYSQAGLADMTTLWKSYPNIAAQISQEHRGYQLVAFEPTVDWLEHSSADVFITSDYVYQRFFESGIFTAVEPTTGEIAEEFRSRRAFYQELFQSARWNEVASFQTGNGPETRIFHRRGADLTQ